jgi:hypothetical protein
VRFAFTPYDVLFASLVLVGLLIYGRRDRQGFWCALNNEWIIGCGMFFAMLSLENM